MVWDHEEAWEPFLLTLLRPECIAGKLIRCQDNSPEPFGVVCVF